MSHTSNRIKNERAARMARSQKHNDLTNMYSATDRKPLVFKEFTDEEIELAKINVRKRIKREKKKIFIKTLIVFSLLCILTYYYFPFWRAFV